MSLMRQVAPCSARIPHDDEDYMTDRATQEAGVDLIASVVDGVLRARNPDTAQVQNPGPTPPHPTPAVLPMSSPQPVSSGALRDRRCARAVAEQILCWGSLQLPG